MSTRYVIIDVRACVNTGTSTAQKLQQLSLCQPRAASHAHRRQPCIIDTCGFNNSTDMYKTCRTEVTNVCVVTKMMSENDCLNTIMWIQLRNTYKTYLLKLPIFHFCSVHRLHQCNALRRLSHTNITTYCMHSVIISTAKPQKHCRLYHGEEKVFLTNVHRSWKDEKNGSSRVPSGWL